MSERDRAASPLGVRAEGASLTDEQCAHIAAWARRRWDLTGDRPAIVVDREHEPGHPEVLHNSDTLYAHPADFLALVRWADAQDRWPLDKTRRAPNMTPKPNPDASVSETGADVEGRWVVFLANGYADCVVPAPALYQPPTHVAVPVVPCDAEAVQRVADELRSMLGDVPLDFRELAEMALRAAGEAPEPVSTPSVPASERLGPEADNHA